MSSRVVPIFQESSTAAEWSSQSPINVCDSDTETELQSSGPPANFQLIRPLNWDRTSKVAVPQKNLSEQWLLWWRQTNWAKAHKGLIITWFEGRKTSDIWQDFQSVAHTSTGEPYVICLHCLQCVTHPSLKNTGTTKLRRHRESRACMKQSRKAVRRTDGDIPTLLLQARDRSTRDTNTSTDNEVSQEEFNKQIILVLAALRLSFQSLSHPELLKLLEMAHQFPRTTPLRVLSPFQARSNLIQQAREARKEILQLIPVNTKIAIALDCWTSPNSLPFLAITGYFIDLDWRYNEILLGFEHIPGKHRGQHLAQVVQYTLKDCEIQLDRISSMTADNAGNNSTLFSSLVDAVTILRNDLDDIAIFKVPCLAHVIQLSCNVLLQGSRTQSLSQRTITERGPQATLDKIRDLVKHIMGSVQRRHNFHDCQSSSKPLNLIRDVPTRWNSTWAMLVRTRKLQQAIKTYIERFPDEPISALTNVEWKYVNYLIEILEKFSRFTEYVGMIRKGPTIHLVLRIYEELFKHMRRYIARLERKKTPWKVRIKQSLCAAYEKLDGYFQDSLNRIGEIYGATMILDPQVKQEYFSDKNPTSINKSSGYRYLQYLQKLHVRYGKAKETSSIQTYEVFDLTTSSFSSVDDSISSRSNHKRKASDLIYPIKRKKARLTTESEIDWYLNDNDNFDVDFEQKSEEKILQYWQRAEGKLPILARLARDILATPAAGVGVERIFNEGRDICTFRRHALKPDAIKHLMILSTAARLHRNRASGYIHLDTEDPADDQVLADAIVEDEDMDIYLISSDEEEEEEREEEGQEEIDDDKEEENEGDGMTEINNDILFSYNLDSDPDELAHE